MLVVVASDGCTFTFDPVDYLVDRQGEWVIVKEKLGWTAAMFFRPRYVTSFPEPKQEKKE